MFVTALTLNQLPCLKATEVKLQSHIMLAMACMYQNENSTTSFHFLFCSNVHTRKAHEEFTNSEARSRAISEDIFTGEN